MRPFGVNASQFTLLVLIAEFGPLSRAALGRENRHDRTPTSHVHERAAQPATVELVHGDYR